MKFSASFWKRGEGSRKRFFFPNLFANLFIAADSCILNNGLGNGKKQMKNIQFTVKQVEIDFSFKII